jgi:predicted N-acyltransferase
MDFDVHTFHSIQEIDPTAWDSLGNGKPFSSHGWYSFGEDVMKDCIPVYILVSQGGKMLARASFWVIRNEPLPISQRLVRSGVQFMLRSRPLFICRSPLANATGLVLPDGLLRQPALDAIIQTAKDAARRYKASFLLFDYLKQAVIEENEWSKDLVSLSVPDPGTKMNLIWPDFDHYLADLKPKVRKHYRQYSRQAEELGIKIELRDQITDIEAAIDLIRNVEKRHGSAPNPWIQGILENAARVRSRWVTARVGDRLIGCEMLLVDKQAQLVTCLGMASDFPHVYFLLGYADIRHAIDIKMKELYWGSGAFEAKKRLGFELEDDNHISFCGIGPIPATFARIMTLVMK